MLRKLAKPLVTEDALLEGYRAMAADDVREAEAVEWAEAIVADLSAVERAVRVQLGL